MNGRDRVLAYIVIALLVAVVVELGFMLTQPDLCLVALILVGIFVVTFIICWIIDKIMDTITRR
jgi:hypothetical protein